MPKVRTNRTVYPEGWELIEPTLRDLETKMREAENETHEGKRKCEALWPIFKISHQKSHYIYDLFYRRKAISRELFDFCLDQGHAQGHADKNFIAKWKKESMTFGEQNSFEDACEQLNMAREEGVNFFDAAEMSMELNARKIRTEIGTSGGAKAYTLGAVVAATSNFKTEIGKGGFGPVFYGKFPDGQEVAVKVSEGSERFGRRHSQGVKEFFNEEHGVECETHDHAVVMTVEEQAKHVGHLDGSLSKNLFLKDKKNRLYVVSALSTTQVDQKGD